MNFILFMRKNLIWKVTVNVLAKAIVNNGYTSDVILS